MRSSRPTRDSSFLPPSYLRLFADREVRIVSENALLERYLRGLGPALARPVDPSEVAGEKWLSFVVSKRRDVFRDYGPLGDWPHGLGRLAINPLYRERRRGPNGDVELELVFPTEWYEFENAESRRYMPANVTASASDLDDVARGRRTPRVEEWIRTSVVVGVPEQIPPNGRTESGRARPERRRLLKRSAPEGRRGASAPPPGLREARTRSRAARPSGLA